MIKRWKEYSYIICLSISAVVIVCFYYYRDLLPQSIQHIIRGEKLLEQDLTLAEFRNQEEIVENLELLKENLTVDFSEKNREEETRQETYLTPEASEGEDLDQAVSKPEASEPEGEIFEGEASQPTMTDEQKEDREKSREPMIFTSDNSYFSDALFIGDSRTEGLREYGNLGQATVLADSGMSIYRLWKATFTIDNKKQTLEQVLAEKKFGKVYLMLGINELGYDREQTINKYREALSRIEEAQPEAFIFLMANLHVTDEKAKNSDIYNNTNINQMNQRLEELAEEKGYIYLDVNPVFDDENGNLSKEYTVDQAHILGIYYTDWGNWILEHCVK